jgi:recombinational DNA repair protein RecR
MQNNTLTFSIVCKLPKISSISNINVKKFRLKTIKDRLINGKFEFGKITEVLIYTHKDFNVESDTTIHITVLCNDINLFILNKDTYIKNINDIIVSIHNNFKK